MVTVIIGEVLLITLWAISWLKKYPNTGMPLARSSSVAISAACHAAIGDENAAIGEENASGVGHRRQP